jgi:hypothetical protein
MNLGAIAWLCAFGSDYRKNPSEMENFYMTWAQGFMSGMNVISLPQYRDLAAMSLDEQKSALRTYCDQHPRLRHSSDVPLHEASTEEALASAMKRLHRRIGSITESREFWESATWRNCYRQNSDRLWRSYDETRKTNCN